MISSESNDGRRTTHLAARHPDSARNMNAPLEAWQRSVERSLTGADY
jgi:hypothetical protein